MKLKNENEIEEKKKQPSNGWTNKYPFIKRYLPYIATQINTIGKKNFSYQLTFMMKNSAAQKFPKIISIQCTNISVAQKQV